MIGHAHEHHEESGIQPAQFHMVEFSTRRRCQFCGRPSETTYHIRKPRGHREGELVSVCDGCFKEVVEDLEEKKRVRETIPDSNGFKEAATGSGQTKMFLAPALLD